jgi:hypothetical protein
MFLVIGQWNGPLQFFLKDNQNICALGTTIIYLFIYFGEMGLLIGLLPKNYEISPSQVEITFFPFFYT